MGPSRAHSERTMPGAQRLESRRRANRFLACTSGLASAPTRELGIAKLASASRTSET